MAQTISEWVAHTWNAFVDRRTNFNRYDTGPIYTDRPDRHRLRSGTERSIISSIYTRIGIDASAVPIKHVRLDADGNYVDTIKSGLNNCLTVEANIDQTGRAFVQDVVMSMCDEGVVAIVAVDTTENPSISNAFDVTSMRTGKILEWMPQHVRVNVYNEKSGNREDITLEKKRVAIIENPLYSVMNETNSTLRRLIDKLNLLDAIDIQSGSGKLDLLISLPYVVKTPTRVAQAEARRKQIEDQLAGSKYGIAYVDGTEKITQLNRPAENNLMAQIEYLTRMLYSQLGITDEVFNGSANEATVLNYHARTIEPILSAIACELTRKFITKTARTQGQGIKHYRDPFSLVTAKELAEISDAYTRNAILSSNEIRGVIGRKPSAQKDANELRNKNINSPDEAGKETEKNMNTDQKGTKSNDRSQL